MLSDTPCILPRGKTVSLVTRPRSSRSTHGCYRSISVSQSGLVTSTQHNIFPKSQTPFPHNHCQTIVSSESGMNPDAITNISSWKQIDLGSTQPMTSF